MSVDALGTGVSFRPIFVLLADGTSARIRAAEPADHDEVLALHERASDESIYRRFFSVSRVSAQHFVEAVCSPTSTMRTLVAVRSGHLVGMASASVEAAEDAEVAFLVDESLHGVGIATALLEQLATWCRRIGVTRFVADVLTENTPMLRVFHDAGFSLHEDSAYGVVTLKMDLREGPESVAASDRRERQAERRSLSALFEPRTVAVLGVSRSLGKIGRQVLENIKRSGFSGRLFAVGRPGLEVPGTTCVSAEDLPVGLDLAVVALPAAEAERAVGLLAQRGTRCCVVVTSGLGDDGEAGRAAELRMSAVAHEHGMRLVGPNCFGVISTLRGTRLNAAFGGPLPPTGSLAVGSQSGGVGLAILDAAGARDTGVACFVSMGNKADVSGNDLIAAWTDDPGVRAAALYLESFHDPRKFARLAATFSRRKPLLVVYGGSSVAGTRAGASHTAAQATPARALHALFHAAGVIAVDSVAELVDASALLTEQPLPRGPRLGIVGNAGGLGIIAADAAHRCGLDVPELGVTTQAALRQAVPGAPGTSNPVDLGAGASAVSFAGAVRQLLTSGEVDALLVSVAATALTDSQAIADAVEEAADSLDLPSMTVIPHSDARTRRTTRFASSEAAVRALRHAVTYQAWLRTADAPMPVPAGQTGETASPGHDAGVDTWLDAEAADAMLSSVGIRSAPWHQLTSPDEAGSAAEAMGFPLVVKTAVPAIVHKTEDALVRMGLSDAGTLSAAVRDVQSRAGAGSPVLVQRQVTGPEIAVGAVRDPRFGPLVMVASGGVAIDLWADQTFLMPPLGRHDVRTALESLRTWPLLNGFRGSRRLDGEAVVDLVLAVGRLALERPDLVELDLNPVVVTEEGPVCVDAKIRIRRPADTSGP